MLHSKGDTIWSFTYESPVVFSIIQWEIEGHNQLIHML